MSVAKMRAFPLPIVYRPRKLFVEKPAVKTVVEETETEDEATRRQRMDRSAVTGDPTETKRARVQDGSEEEYDFP